MPLLCLHENPDFIGVILILRRTIVQKNQDEEFMQRALDLATLATGRTNPNPMVGAVIVKDNRIIGEGYHHKAGTPHAEVHALKAAGDNSREATVYVSLEPCSHFGKTPPCADALIKAGVKRVVIAMVDPNPKVAGQGIKRLKNAGVEVEVGVLEKQARRINEVFLKHIQTGKPFVAMKTAMTLDGKIACASGDSKWITNEESRAYVHQLRNTYEAIMVGIGTVLKDDPRLNTRLDVEDLRDPIRVIIDTHLELPVESHIVQSASEQRTIVYCSNRVDQQPIQLLESKGIEVIAINDENGFLPLAEVFKSLYEFGICSLLVEGGGEVNGYLVQHQLVDKLYWFVAPKILGGRESLSPVGGAGIQQMKDAYLLNQIEIQRFGEDVLFTAYPANN